MTIIGKWFLDDYDECGRHWRCRICKKGIIVSSLLGLWVPDICPNCQSKMKEE